MPELREYQKEAVKLLVERKRQLLCDEMGLGKSASTIAALQELGCQTILIATHLKITQAVWMEEILKWFSPLSPCEMHIFNYTGTSTQRETVWSQFQKSNGIRFFICSGASLEKIRIQRPKWDAIVLDEYHLMGLLNRDTKAFETVRRFISPVLFMLTGTPVAQGAPDFWVPLNLLDRAHFGSYWTFVQLHCAYTLDYMGHRLLERLPKHVTQFKDMLKPYMIRRMKKDVVTELPPLQRQRLPLEMNSIQRKLYDQLEEDMIAEYGGKIVGIPPNSITQILRQRQLLITPRLLEVDDDGALLEQLPHVVKQALNDCDATIIFSPFAKALDHIEKAIQRNIKHKSFFISGEHKGNASTVVKAFNETPGRRILYCTIKSGISFTATVASTAFFIGAEWDAISNSQAESRIHRLGQMASNVTCYYTHYKGTVEDRVFEMFFEKDQASEEILA